jgi:hypothetical protein
MVMETVSHGEAQRMGFSGVTCSNPVFILSAARSGSTLLRYALDAHPAIASPPEPNLSELLIALRATLQSTAASPAQLEGRLRVMAHQIAQETIGEYGVPVRIVSPAANSGSSRAV